MNQKNLGQNPSQPEQNEASAAHVHGPHCQHDHHHGPLTPITRHSPKVGRNDPCPCGSQKKYKKCCGG